MKHNHVEYFADKKVKRAQPGYSQFDGNRMKRINIYISIGNILYVYILTVLQIEVLKFESIVLLF